MHVVILLTGFMIYIFLLLIALIVGGLSILSEKKEKKTEGKIIISVIAISYPVLVVVGAAFSLMTAFPFMITIYLFDLNFNPAIAVVLSLILIVVVALSFYHWYLGSRILVNYFYNKPLDKGIENDFIFSLFIKRVINWNRKRITRWQR